MKTYTPLSPWGPAYLAGAILLSGYVIGPAIGRVLSWRTLARCNQIFDLTPGRTTWQHPPQPPR